MRDRLSDPRIRLLRSALYEIRTDDLEVLSRGRLLQLLITGLVVPLTFLSVARVILSLLLQPGSNPLAFYFPLGTLLTVQAVALLTAGVCFALLRRGELGMALHLSLAVLDLAILWLCLRLPAAIPSLATITLLPILASAVLSSLRDSVPYAAVTLVAIPILLAISGGEAVSYAVINLVLVMAIVAFSNTLNEASQESRELTQDILNLADSLQERVHEQTAALRRRAIQLEHGVEVGRVASLSLELPQLIRETTSIIQRRFGLRAVEIVLLPAAQMNAESADLPRPPHVPSADRDALVRWVAEHREARRVVLDPAQGDSRRRAAIGLPLFIRGQVTGVLYAEGVADGPPVGEGSDVAMGRILPEDQVVLQLVADQIAASLENARLFTIAQRRADLLGQLPQVATNMARQATVLNMLNAFALRTRPLLRADGVSVWLRAPDTTELHLAIRHVEAAPGDPDADPTATSGLPAQLMLENRILVVEELDRWPNPLEAATALVPGIKAGSCLVLPIREERQPIGIAAFARRRQEHPFSGEEVQFCEALALQLGVILHNNQLLAEASRLARREQQINQITAGLRGSLDVTTTLEQAAASLGEALGTARVRIRLENGGAGDDAASAGSSARRA